MGRYSLGLKNYGVSDSENDRNYGGHGHHPGLGHHFSPLYWDLWTGLGTRVRGNFGVLCCAMTLNPFSEPCR